MPVTKYCTCVLIESEISFFLHDKASGELQEIKRRNIGEMCQISRSCFALRSRSIFDFDPSNET